MVAPYGILRIDTLTDTYFCFNVNLSIVPKLFENNLTTFGMQSHPPQNTFVYEKNSYSFHSSLFFII